MFDPRIIDFDCDNYISQFIIYILNKFVGEDNHQIIEDWIQRATVMYIFGLSLSLVLEIC